MDIYRAQVAYKRHQGKPNYRDFTHDSIPPDFCSFLVKIPVDFLPWDSNGGLLAFPKAQKVMGICRCGVVEKTKYVKPKKSGSKDIALKIMNKDQIHVQTDDVNNEVQVMTQLQKIGLDHLKPTNPHFLLWGCGADKHNEYIATELAANGSLIQFARKKINELKIKAKYAFAARAKNEEELNGMIRRSVGNTWMIEGLKIFSGLIDGMIYMHEQNVCHLDIDPCNIVIDKNNVVRLIDFGSSQIMKENGLAGVGDVRVKFKPLFVAREVRQNNQKPAPRPGFHGRPADIWSAGVMLYQLVWWGHPGGEGSIVRDLFWKKKLWKHILAGKNNCGECRMCKLNVVFPDFVFDIFQLMLHPNPDERGSAKQISSILSKQLKYYGQFENSNLVPPEIDPFDESTFQTSSAPGKVET